MDSMSFVPVATALISALGTIIAAMIALVGRGVDTPQPVPRLRPRTVAMLLIVFVITIAAVALIIGKLSPRPTARIIQPIYTTGPVGMQSKVVVQFNNMPSDQYLWVVVHIPKVQPKWVVFPQLLNGLPQHLTGSGTYEMTVQLGNQADSGEVFNVVVVAVNEEVNKSFIEYSKVCMSVGNCGGIQLPDAGAEILDFSTLIRAKVP